MLWVREENNNMVLKFTAGLVTALLLMPGVIMTAVAQEQWEADTLVVNRLLDEADDMINRGLLDEAENKVKTADSLSNLLNFRDGKARSVLRTADILIHRRNLDPAVSLLNEALNTYSDSRRLPNLYNMLATAYNYRNDSDMALEMYEKSLNHINRLPESNRARTRAAVRQNMATVQMSTGQTALAFENYLMALRFSEATGDTLFWAITLNNVGMAYYDQDDSDNAAYYLEKAMALAEEKELLNELYRTNLNLGNVRLDQGRPEEALLLYRKAVEVNNITRPDTPPVQVLYNLGRLYHRLERYEEAEGHFNESLDFSRERGIREGIYFNNQGLGRLKVDLGETSVARDHFNEAREAAESLGYPDFIRDIHFDLFELNKEEGNYRAALVNFERYSEVTDSLESVERQTALEDLKSKLELDRRNLENKALEEIKVAQEQQIRLRNILLGIIGMVVVLVIFLLYRVWKSDRENKRFNVLLEDQKVELQKINEGKDSLFAVLAHDLRSPLISMQGLLYMIRQQQLSEEKLDHFISELEEQLESNRNILDDVLIWAREQMSGLELNIQPVSVSDVIEEITGNHRFHISNKGLEIQTSEASGCTAMADTNGLKLALRNILSNAIKFTPEGGIIKAGCASKGDRVIISVEDNGKGIPLDIRDSLFTKGTISAVGIRNEQGTGTGLKLSRDFIRKMDGDIRFETETGAGTTFYIDLPKA